jgi:recombination protein RecA
MGHTVLSELLSSRRVRRASNLADASGSARFRLAEISGRLVELSGSGASSALTVAVGLVLEAQRAGEPVAWVSAAEPFFPPDLSESGVDLEALVVVRIPPRSSAVAHRRSASPPTPQAGLRAADQLLRSGGFGLVVLDLGPVAGLPLPAQTRLAGLAQRHDSLLLCLTEKKADAPSLGSLISLHAWARRRRLHDGRFACEVQVLKDKRRGPGWVHREVCRGPAGLR